MGENNGAVVVGVVERIPRLRLILVGEEFGLATGSVVTIHFKLDIILGRVKREVDEDDIVQFGGFLGGVIRRRFVADIPAFVFLD